ncbi:sensor histidine kinase [Nocardioides maradonensis]
MGGRRASTAHRTPTNGSSLERGLQLVVGLVIAAKTVVFGFEIAARGDRTSSVLGLATIVVLCLGTAAVLCLLGRAGPIAVALATLALVAGSVLPRDHVPLPGAADSPILHLVEPMLLAVVTRRHPWVLIAALDLLFVGLRWATGGSRGLEYGVQEAVFISGTVLAVVVLVHQVRSAWEHADATLRSHRHLAEGQTRAEIEATSALHDDVIPALIALAVGESTPSTRSAAGHGLEAMGTRPETPGPQGMAEQILELAAGTGLDVSVSTSGPSIRLSEVVRQALASAVREALRNVARHSGQRTAEVHVSRLPGRVRISIVDHGVGFDGTTGVGLRVAVTERVRAVGGTAHIVSSPGSGTSVEIGWQTGPLLARVVGWTREDDRLIRLALGDPARPALGPIVALAAGYLATAVILAVQNHPQPATYAGFVGAAGLVAVLLLRMRSGQVPWWGIALTSLATAGILALVLPTVSPAGLGGLESWIIESTALPALAAVWQQSLRVTLLMLVPNAVVIASAAHRDHLPVSVLPHLLLVQPLNAVFVGVIALVCRRAGRVVDDAALLDVAAARAAATRQVLGARYEAVVAALLAGARGQALGPEVGRLAHAVRDCLYLPGPAHARLRDALDDLRRRGAAVETTIREEPFASDALAGVLRALDGTTAQRVTLSTSAGRASVVVVPGIVGPRAAPLRASVSRLGWGLVEDDDATVINATVGPPLTP